MSIWELFVYPSDIKAVSSIPLWVDLAQYCIVAYFNALEYGDHYPVTASQVEDMWLDGTGSGYCAVAGCSVAWTAQDIIDYFKSIGV